MAVTEITARTLLRRHKRVDSWFVARYGMNLYRGCRHGCAYCDGRAERYHVDGEFGRDVAVKLNAAELLDRELDPARHRVPRRPGFVLLGGGVGDSWGPPDDAWALARRALEVVGERGYPVHVLTKSTGVARDLDLLRAIHADTRAIVSVSLSTVRDDLAAFLEPGCPPPSERLALLADVKRAGLPAGIYLMPVLPYLSDGDGSLDAALREAAALELDFVICAGLTLKPGRQQAHYLSVLARHRPELVRPTEALYPGTRWGHPDPSVHDDLDWRFARLARRHGVARRIPAALWSDRVDDNDRLVVHLEQLADLLRWRGTRTPFRKAARAIADLDHPADDDLDALQARPEIGPAVARMIEEILATGSCGQYERALRDGPR